MELIDYIIFIGLFIILYSLIVNEIEYRKLMKKYKAMNEKDEEKKHL
jgi:NhaP-type Na+/H+ or K+/H+ antiporter